MKVVILAGGLGSRIGEESVLRPKPLLEIGEKPVLWHIMKTYSHYGFNDFIICLGYKGFQIKEYFANYFLHESDVTFDFCDGRKEVIHRHAAEAWRVTLVNTGMGTATGGRIKRIKKYLQNEPFMMTYGDGVSDVNIKDLLSYHQKHGKLATVTAVKPMGRFGALSVGKNNEVKRFQEKPEGDKAWISGGYFVFQPKVLDYIKGDEMSLEGEPLEKLAKQRQLMTYKHSGFWQPMDTLRERKILESLWSSGKAPWKVWE
ncbi:MAG: glucose-1-phosphate cytidylyltransferase [bacterium]